MRADDKPQARLNLICDLLLRLPYADKDESVLRPDPVVVFDFERACLDNGMLST